MIYYSYIHYLKIIRNIYNNNILIALPQNYEESIFPFRNTGSHLQCSESWMDQSGALRKMPWQEFWICRLKHAYVRNKWLWLFDSCTTCVQKERSPLVLIAGTQFCSHQHCTHCIHSAFIIYHCDQAVKRQLYPITFFSVLTGHTPKSPPWQHIWPLATMGHLRQTAWSSHIFGVDRANFIRCANHLWWIAVGTTGTPSEAGYINSNDIRYPDTTCCLTVAMLQCKATKEHSWKKTTSHLWSQIDFRAVKTWPGMTCRHTVMLQSTPLRGQGRGTMVVMMMMMMQFHWEKQLASQNTSDWSVLRLHVCKLCILSGLSFTEVVHQRHQSLAVGWAMLGASAYPTCHHPSCFKLETDSLKDPVSWNLRANF